MIRYAEQECSLIAKCDMNPVCISNFKSFCSESLIPSISTFNITDAWSKINQEIKLINSNYETSLIHAYP